MLNKKLIRFVPGAMPHVIKSVLLQTISLISSIILMFTISHILYCLFFENETFNFILSRLTIIIPCIVIRVACTFFSAKQNYMASKAVKPLLRKEIYNKIVRIGRRYNKKIGTAELLQLSVEGIEQIETYFSGYLPQFFYSMLAPILLFISISFISVKVAIILFICVPLIPISIIIINRIAKKLLAKYWGEYLKLGDNFLENLQGLNTLKIYDSDEYMHQKMNRQAEQFRIITMKVLSMQLNSIIVMDLVAYGGAAIGIIFALLEYSRSNIGFIGCFAIIMLSADFFLPLRVLGSFFHIAMNGMTAAKKIFLLLETEEDEPKTKTISNTDISINNLSYSYNKDDNALTAVNLSFPKNSFTAIVGKSGCGKSTIAGILQGKNTDYSGSITIGDVELSSINLGNLNNHITLISANSYIFGGTVKENLLVAKPEASDSELWLTLDAVNLSDFLHNEEGLSTKLLERGSNLSGGQCQRLALARALLHDSEIYIFDEATSNIDVESENDIMAVLKSLSNTKTIILISHRLANVIPCDKIYVLETGQLVQQGTHDQLLNQDGAYKTLWQVQLQLEGV